jgi:hypothetical protein
MLFVCKLGTAGSATLLTSYIADQMWSRTRRVNVYGILQYVRRRRWMAFEHTGDKNFTFWAQVQIAYVIAYGLAKYRETGKGKILNILK